MDWEPKHVTIDLFEAKNIAKINLASQLQALFEEYKQINKMSCYGKNEDINMFMMTNALKQIVNYEELKILTPFEGVCFRHALFKAYQYATFDEKLSSSSQHVNINSIQSSIEACQKN